MKIKFSVLLVLAISLAFTSCKKSSTATTDPQLTPQQVASQVALNFSSTLLGGSGGLNIGKGLNAPQSLAVHTKSKRLNDLSDGNLCGLTVDTTFNSTVAFGDSTITVAGTINFSFNCSGGALSGFTTNDNFNLAYSSPQLAIAEKSISSLTLTVTNVADSTADVALSGSSSTSGSYQYKTGTKRTGTEAFSYTLTNLLIDPNSSSIVSGSAKFSTSGSGPRGVWNYQGTITFLPNNLATIVINGKTYNVNLLTGIVS
ncbi:hypothetical protein JN11_00124 [Mucilaginibacter frigoritolerans]|uniref:Uncharacterized protein n=1 Tax=Mucilaginibacter frigoritolerans TaxID=652788 RepID=A0A562UF39_9SPHI|nr:hypothetical protein [Mucilaginibacter frigoritolerans]TWJ04416.1 hypothetical protein JN11_00124 [Mucilaginibacter frigoritolerans]